MVWCWWCCGSSSSSSSSSSSRSSSIVFVVVVVVVVESLLRGQFVPGERRRFICELRQQAARSASNVCVCMHVCVRVVAVAVCGSRTFGPEPALPEVGVDQHAHA
jgi:hypothetical protein